MPDSARASASQARSFASKGPPAKPAKKPVPGATPVAPSSSATDSGDGGGPLGGGSIRSRARRGDPRRALAALRNRGPASPVELLDEDQAEALKLLNQPPPTDPSSSSLDAAGELWVMGCICILNCMPFLGFVRSILDLMIKISLFPRNERQ